MERKGRTLFLSHPVFADWLAIGGTNKRIIVGAQILRQKALASNRTVEHPTECGTFDRFRMDAEANDPERVLIHDDQDPMGPQRCRLAPEQIHAPEAVFHVAREAVWPGRAIGVLSRPVVTCENSANHVFVDLDVERQGDLLCDSRTAQLGLRCFISTTKWMMDEFRAGSFRTGLPMAIR